MNILSKRNQRRQIERDFAKADLQKVREVLVRRIANEKRESFWLWIYSFFRTTKSERELKMLDKIIAGRNGL